MNVFKSKAIDSLHPNLVFKSLSAFMPSFARRDEKAKARKQGSVAIVGAGPGDAELLTIKAYKALQSADIVMFDWLVDESVLRLIPAQVEKEFVGKRAGRHSMVQDDICRRMLMHAQAGKTVVRLKGGDPAIFARTVEESDILTKHDIPFYIVPGITAASGASAYSGIPLTHRDCAQSVRFITASLRNPESEPKWQEIVDSSNNQTLVFYMGLKKLSVICTRLQQHGMAENMPVAVIDKACTEGQRMVKSTVESVAQRVNEEKFDGPAMIIVGKVVNYEQLVSKKLMKQAQLISSF
ncbi:uroporphyrinogen-III C-methyltransferase [Glaciecola sp. MH2013]|uniref:uroporphyrinogen-III C-methyltransferase n=1 Tax=Glaciecola sp. MH2013 TaxID=2785524 RepID=UPI00189EAA83|nr:uroporphyrinogen-III C-methyltransferase [Glaciecola sp. MH2013]MBF7073603.1 uroporphyrinogen-III C-methyltransferase [Glaciecola sp. MH2013]